MRLGEQKRVFSEDIIRNYHSREEKDQNTISEVEKSFSIPLVLVDGTLDREGPDRLD